MAHGNLVDPVTVARQFVFQAVMNLTVAVRFYTSNSAGAIEESTNQIMKFTSSNVSSPVTMNIVSYCLL
jgi:hypothetical protein